METFDTAPAALARIVAAQASHERCRDGIIVRDVFGRLTFVSAKLSEMQASNVKAQAQALLPGFVDPAGEPVLKLPPQSQMWASLLREPSLNIQFSTAPDDIVRLIDRRLAGEDWLLRPRPLIETGPKRLVFYSLKGGVGRSTALCVAAADLAERGIKVLVLDLDLEAPGLASLLLSKARLPDLGVIDWFAAAAAGCDTSAIEPQMVATSDLTTSRAVVDVVPATGKLSNPQPGSYLAKLARAYTPGSAGTHLAEKGFADKLNAMIDSIASLKSYDVILIDARAGLHETCAALLLGLGAQVLLFGVDTSQTYDDYEILLSTFTDTFSPDSGNADLRGAFKMVHAKAPSDARDRAKFVNASWNLWTEYLYDEADPASGAGTFTFDITDQSGPHFPLEIVGDPQFERFDPRLSAYQLEQRTYVSAFGDFLSGVRQRLEIA